MTTRWTREGSTQAQGRRKRHWQILIIFRQRNQQCAGIFVYLKCCLRARYAICEDLILVALILTLSKFLCSRVFNVNFKHAFTSTALKLNNNILTETRKLVLVNPAKTFGTTSLIHFRSKYPQYKNCSFNLYRKGNLRKLINFYSL